MSQKAQLQKIIKMNISDKKLMRLFHCNTISDKDVVFLNNAYQQKQNIHFRYSIVFTAISTIALGYFFTRFSPASTQLVFYGGFGYVQHIFWSALLTKRFELLVAPYYEKYQIK